MNAQKKVIDVWLNYRCDRCNEAWKMPVLERVPVATVPADWMEAFFHNDPVMVRRWAFDMTQLTRHTERLDVSDAVEVRRTQTRLGADLACPSIRLNVPLPCAVRLDRLLASELGYQRAELHRLYECGELRISPARRKPLRARIHDGQQLWLPS